MNRSRYPIAEPQAPHFMTFIMLEWLSVFMRPDTVQVLLEAFIYRQQNQVVRLYGDVILGGVSTLLLPGVRVLSNKVSSTRATTKSEHDQRV